MRKNLFLCFLIVLTFAKTSAQKITVNASLDSTVLWVGNQAHLSFQISQQPKQKVITPLFSEHIVPGIELVEPVKNDTVKSPDGVYIITQRYVITAFEDSLHYIPAFPFICNGDTVWSKSLSLKVVQPYQIDTASQQIADIKPVLDPKLDLLIVRKYWQKKPIFETTPEPILPPHILAINKLDSIKQSKAWQTGRFKEYHTELTDVIREYIEQVFDINSMEMTSDEILEHLMDLRIDNKSAYQALKQILQLADLVKFAKWNATPDEHETSLKNAYLFVNQTTKETTISTDNSTSK
jgi:hypothetical protein